MWYKWYMLQHVYNHRNCWYHGKICWDIYENHYGYYFLRSSILWIFNLEWILHYSDCPPNCQCRCHKEKSIAEVAIDMALLTANANQVSHYRKSLLSSKLSITFTERYFKCFTSERKVYNEILSLPYLNIVVNSV